MSVINERPTRTLQIHERLLGKNAEIAANNRKQFEERGIFTLNVLSSPGSGKTALLERLLRERGACGEIAIIVGDLATDRDAARLAQHGSRVLQVNTGSICHLEADMIARACDALGLDGVDTLVIENVGNLVCPAGYDLGEAARIMLLSVTEGEDKPLKYPKAFRSADLVLLTKIDLAPHVGFNRKAAMENIRAVAPQATVLEISSQTGVNWGAFLALLAEQKQHATRRR